MGSLKWQEKMESGDLLNLLVQNVSKLYSYKLHLLRCDHNESQMFSCGLVNPITIHSACIYTCTNVGFLLNCISRYVLLSQIQIKC